MSRLRDNLCSVYQFRQHFGVAFASIFLRQKVQKLKCKCQKAALKILVKLKDSIFLMHLFYVILLILTEKRVRKPLLGQFFIGHPCSRPLLLASCPVKGCPRGGARPLPRQQRQQRQQRRRHQLQDRFLCYFHFVYFFCILYFFQTNPDWLSRVISAFL